MSDKRTKIIEVLLSNNLLTTEFNTVNFAWLSTESKASCEELDELLDQLEKERYIDQIVLPDSNDFKIRLAEQ